MTQPCEKLDLHDIYLGRQPIFDASLEVVAYELLYRDSEANFARITDQEAATSHVIINAFMEFGINALAGDRMVFVNLPRGFVLGDIILSLPAGRVVLEILETVLLDNKVAVAIKKLTSKGFQIALDDVADRNVDLAVLRLADLIKIDLMAIEQSQLPSIASYFKSQGKKLLAEKVETHEELLLCKQLGFDYYQGYFFSKPQIVKGAKLPPKQVAILKLLTRLFDPDVTFDELETLLSQDVSLSYKLMRIINSAAYSLPNQINSIKQALSILGVRNIRNWVSLIAFSGVENKPSELFRMAMVRAKMCEVLAQAAGRYNPDTYFTAGLFSMLDAIMDKPLADLLQPLPFADEIVDGLINLHGPIGQALLAVMAYEKGDVDNVAINGLSMSQINDAYLHAIDWERSISQSLKSK
ncbi:EAL and HDOD domain-containing protein [Kaarinaea lacus]